MSDPMKQDKRKVQDGTRKVQDETRTAQDETRTVQNDARVVVRDMRVMAEDLVKTVKNVVREGNVRRITIKDREGRTVASFPLSVGLIGAVLSPALAAIGALSAVLTECTLVIEKTE
jgi:hypothetical protein